MLDRVLRCRNICKLDKTTKYIDTIYLTVYKTVHRREGNATHIPLANNCEKRH